MNTTTSCVSHLDRKGRRSILTVRLGKGQITVTERGVSAPLLAIFSVGIQHNDPQFLRRDRSHGEPIAAGSFALWRVKKLDGRVTETRPEDG